MVKKLAFLFLFSVLSISLTAAQENSAYELQRVKINTLLAERSAKFGQYDQSLNERTGIFGFQTKRDIKNSNEILRQIALNDNEIFTQLKVLLDYKDLQVEEVKSTISTTSESIQNYRRTIKNLQEAHQKLTLELDKSEKHTDLIYLCIAALFMGCGYLMYQLNRKNRQLKTYEKATI